MARKMRHNAYQSDNNWTWIKIIDITLNFYDLFAAMGILTLAFDNWHNWDLRQPLRLKTFRDQMTLGAVWAQHNNLFSLHTTPKKLINDLQLQKKKTEERYMRIDPWQIVLFKNTISSLIAHRERDYSDKDLKSHRRYLVHITTENDQPDPVGWSLYFGIFLTCSTCLRMGHFKKYHNTLCLSSEILHKHCFYFPLGPL